MNRTPNPYSSDCFAELLTLLKRRLEIVADRDWYQRDPAGHLAGLQKAAAALEERIARLPSDVDPMLRHYLDRQSYLKACEWLQNALEQSQAES